MSAHTVLHADLGHLAVVLPLVALLGGGVAEAMYRCPHDNVLRVKCCCPTAKAQPEGDALSQGRCCTVERAAEAAPTPAQPTTSDELRPIAPAIVASILTLHAPAPQTRPIEARARAPDKPSLLLQKTSFLL